MRLDLTLLQEWVRPNSRVLDLGCGDGWLLQQLRDNRQVDGLGVEFDAEQINLCLRRGLNVIEQDLNEGLANFGTDSFDVVIMAHALQTLRNPHRVIDEMLRIGRECVVSFPNFGHWRNRLYLASHGRMPISNFLPYTWYNTPNIHFFTVRDFEDLCREKGITVLNRGVINAANRQSRVSALWPNMFGMTAVYQLSK